MIRTCAVCGNDFEWVRGKHSDTKKTCSKDCRYKATSMAMSLKTEKHCLQCERAFSVKPALQRLKFCSPACYAASMRGVSRPIEWYDKRRGSEPWNKGTKLPEMAAQRMGPGNPNWKGGVYATNRALRTSPAHKRWSRAVKERDGYHCVACGTPGSSRSLHADHILPFAEFPDSRFNVDNGRALCIPCHQDSGRNRRHRLRRTRITMRPALLFALLLASPVSAQLTDTQLRAKVDSAAAQLTTIRTELTRRIDATAATPTPPPPTGASVLWATSWATATGSTAQARTDGGKLTDYPWSTSILSVIARPSGLPTAWPANVLRVTYAGQAAQLVGVSGRWAAPVVGAKACFRFLLWSALPNGSGVAFEHGMQSNVGALQHYWQVFSPEGGSSAYLGWGGAGTAGNDFATAPSASPLRVEECYTRTATLRARVDLRVTNESTGVVLTNADFRGNWGEGASVLVGREITFANEMDGFRSYLFGASGSSGGTGSVYVTGFAVCSDWCGPYRAGES